MSWTSYGTMFHSRSRPVTLTMVPRSRRAASRIVANASGRISSRVSAIVAPQLALDAAGAVGSAQLVVQLLALGGVGRDALLLLELRDARLERGGALAEQCAELLRLASELLLRDRAEPLLVRVNRIDDRHAAASFRVRGECQGTP